MRLPPGCVLRRAGAADAAAVRALTRAAYARWVPVIGREPMPMTADHERAVREHRVDLLVENGRLAALIETVLRDVDLLIENIAVDPDRQGGGFGALLLAHAERLATAAGRSAVRLYTNEKMVANIGLYARRGYLIEGRESVPVGVRVHMVKPLGAGSPGAAA